MFANRKMRRRADALSRNSKKVVRRHEFRPALLGTVTASALMMATPQAVHAQVVPGDPQCIIGGATVTCTGDLSTGIDVDGPAFDTLNVNNVNAPGITPAAGVEGVNFTSAVNQNITINVDTSGTPGIVTTGNADGIFADINGDGNISVTSTGNITSQVRDGIDLETTNGDINLTSTGNITAPDDHAIDINVVNDGNVNVVSVGDLTTAPDGGEAIEVDVNGDGNIFVMSTGNIHADNDGIELAVDGLGNVTIISMGNITTDQNDGLEGETNGGTISITSVGNLMTADDGFEADLNGDGNIIINNTGNVTSMNNDGINADISGTGDIMVTSAGNITANSNGDFGIDVDTSMGTSTVNILNGVIDGGDGAGAGVAFNSPAGQTNILNITGAVTLSSLGGTAVLGGAGDTTINNSGVLNTLVNGDIILGGGANAFNNMGGGVFNAGPVINLGAGNTLTNDGDLSLGGVGAIQTTALTGNMVQNASGTFTVDVDLTAAMADRLNVTGTANLAGNVAVQVINPIAGPQQQTILSAAGNTTNNGLGVIASPALQASLLFPNATDVVLSTDVNFAAPGAELNPNQTNVGNSINGAFAAGGGALDPVILALLTGPTNNATFQNALDQLGGEVFLNEDTSALFGAQAFTNQLFSCQMNGDEYTAISEGSCLWVRLQGRYFDRDQTALNVGFDDRASGISVGGQKEFKPDWFAGFALGYERGYLDTDAGADSDRDTYHAGLSLKHTLGQFALSGAIIGGVSSFETTRNIGFGGFTATNTSDHDISYFGAQIRAAYLHEVGAGYIKPLVDINLTYLDRDGFTESGNPATALVVQGDSETFFSVSPAVEFGTDHRINDTQVMRFYGKAGLTYYADDEHTLNASFAGAPGGTPGFAATTQFDDLFVDLEAGVTVLDNSTATIQFGYQGRLSDDSEQHGGFVKANMKF